MEPIDKRISGLKGKLGRNGSVGNLQEPNGPLNPKLAGPGFEGEREDFGRLLRESRERPLNDDTDETSITEQMLNHPENGRFWRLMEAARKRVGARLAADENLK
ncbi:MAG: hypothetical protein P4L43_16660 [Syntrophobacteraceae bacterium]|nr:hypothetical protein [Syntrophobacteraceae bacterium]